MALRPPPIDLGMRGPGSGPTGSISLHGWTGCGKLTRIIGPMRELPLSEVGSIRRAQPVADAGLGQHELRTLRVGLDLLPELAHIDAQILRVGQFVPQLLQQEAM